MGLKLTIAVSLFCFAAANVSSQSVEQLRSAYSGTLAWDKAAATVRFVESGAINFTNVIAHSFIRQIPTDVKHFSIAKGVTVNGAFHSKASVTIAGKDRKTSLVYGTDEQRWSQNRGIKAFTLKRAVGLGSSGRRGAQVCAALSHATGIIGSGSAGRCYPSRHVEINFPQ